MTVTYPNTWQGVTDAAIAAGAKYPELVAAQWALESGWGKHAPGHNYFGLKGKGQSFKTQEEVNGKMIDVVDDFMTFKSLGECVEYLVKLWYSDYKDYTGVNSAANRNAAARMLQKEGYATDSGYAHKLIKLMDEHAVKPAATPVAKPAKPASGGKPPAKAVMFLAALQDTWLKKKPGQAIELPEKERSAVEKGRRLGVVKLEELPGDAHARVTLAAGAGEWLVFQPHFKVEGTTSGGAAPVVPSTPRPINWNDFNAKVSEHLTVGEVLQWDARRRPAANSADIHRILQTAKEFEALRKAWGRPLGVTSFYRPEPYNRQVGGSSQSRHINGRAMDIYPVDGSIESFYQWIRVRWRGGLGDGRPRGFIHLDIDGGGFVPGAGARPSAEWYY